MIYKDEETPCSKIARYFQKFIDNAFDEFRNGYKASLAKLNNVAEDQELDEPAYEKLLKDELPFVEAPTLRLGVGSVKDLSFTLTHDIFKQTLRENFKLTPQVILYDEDLKYLKTITIDSTTDKGYFSVVHDIYDGKLKCPDDVAIRLRLQNFGESISYVFLVIQADNVNSIGKCKYSRFRLTDFDTNFQYDCHKLAEEYSFGDLKGTGGDEAPAEAEGVEDEGADSGLFFAYYLHKNDKYGWFLENLKQQKLGTKAEIESFIKQDIPDFLGQFEHSEMDYVDFNQLNFIQESIEGDEDADPLNTKFLFQCQFKGDKFIYELDSFLKTRQKKSRMDHEHS